MDYFNSQSEFWQVFDKFNAFYDAGHGWKDDVARAEYLDMFGRSIAVGEPFFRIHADKGPQAVLKLSLASMEKLLFSLMVLCPRLDQLGEQLVKEEIARMLGAIRGLDATDTLHP